MFLCLKSVTKPCLKSVNTRRYKQAYDKND